ncbi:MAG: hypothetical protein JKY33_07955 [Bacteroidia bacterium]|nr:hypothetical protein [Bacteroidia bacterium]
MFLKRPYDFFLVFFGDQTWDTRMLFNYDTNWPTYWNDPRAFSVTKLITPFSFIGFQRFIPTSIIFSAILYSGNWRLFLVFSERYKEHTGKLAIVLLYMPTMLFWGSGILKDSITFSALGWFIYSLHNIMKARKIPLNFVFIIISILFILRIKPYIIYALIPGALIWISYAKFVNIRSSFLKILLIPLILAFSVWFAQNIITNISQEVMQEFSMDTILEKARLTQEDLTRAEQYGENYFDLGSFDASINSIVPKIPMAIVSCLYRPFLWEVKGFAMLLSGLENTIILIFSILIIYKRGIIATLKMIGSDPFLLFVIFFVLIFSFGVGLSTPNFGALVRYRLPAIVLYSCCLIIFYFKDSKGFYYRNYGD